MELCARLITGIAFLFSLLAGGVFGQDDQVRCHACDSVQMPECADPFETTDSVFTCDYTETVGQIGRALRVPDASIPEVKQTLHTNFPTRIQPEPRDERPPGQCAKFTIAKEGHPSIVIRGCSRRGNNTCNYVRQATELFKSTLESCDICSGDLCNSSTSISPRIFILALCVLQCIFNI